jgi:hypothetical protein
MAIAEIRSSPGKRPKSKREFCEEALKKFPGRLTRNRFLEKIWPEALKAVPHNNWSRGGASKKPSGSKR